jgi:hypothetical protein
MLPNGITSKYDTDNGFVGHHQTYQYKAPPGAGSSLDGYVSVNPAQQHVNYVGADGHVHELVYDNGWSHNDLTNDAGGAPPPAAGSSLDGYVSVNPAQQHVNYVGADGHVHELVYDNGWSHNDLSDGSTGATVYYGVVDYSPDSRQIMSVLTHEVYEAATDPDVTTGYFDHAKGGETEIGDLCSAVTMMDKYPVRPCGRSGTATAGSTARGAQVRALTRKELAQTASVGASPLTMHGIAR